MRNMRLHLSQIFWMFLPGLVAENRLLENFHALNRAITRRDIWICQLPPAGRQRAS